MPRHDFRALFARYPSVIRQMPDTFTSHAFIAALAHDYPALYIEALCAYVDTHHRGKPAPFMMVHSILSRRLNACSHLIYRHGQERCRDLFGQMSACSRWKKLPLGLYPFPALEDSEST
jgi:hypothetical protein